MMSIEDIIAARQKEKERAAIERDSLGAAKSGGISGALLSGGMTMLRGERSIPKILLKALLGGTTGAAAAGGSTYLGSQVLGVPKEGEAGGYTNRGILGGALAGGLVGGGAGALLGSGALGRLAASKLGQKGMQWAEKELPIDNYLTDAIKWAAKKPGKDGALKTAGALGILGGAGAGLMGASEGMQLDYLKSLRDQEEDDYGPY